MNGFGPRLDAVVAARGSAICVGIDPHPPLLTGWGLDVDVSGLERCARTMVEALGDRAAVFKPQSAFFEAFGSAGVAVLERVLADIAAAGAIALLDVKRGDLDSTMAGYARAYLADGSALAADAITVSPYLGFGSLDPVIDAAVATGRGVFVLARTSNPDSGAFQTATTPQGRTVAQSIIDEAGRRNAALTGVDLTGADVTGADVTGADVTGADVTGADPADDRMLGPIGVVVGATRTDSDLDLSALGGAVLAPGVGAQGASVADAQALLGGPGLVLPSLSRSLMAAGPDVAALRTAFAALHPSESGAELQS